jgi:hypothetical protein
MLKAYRVRECPENGGGLHWSILDDETGDFMHGAVSNDKVTDLLVCWTRKYHDTGRLVAEMDGKELTPNEFARMAYASRVRMVTRTRVKRWRARE